MKNLVVMALVGAGLLVAGCKSTPPLTQDQAMALIQAKYDQTPAVGVTINMTKDGMGMGITDGYWKLTRVYPNRFWADYTLTDDGKKAVKVPGGGDVIQWRPQSMTDTNYVVTMQTVTANHLKARDMHDVSDETLPGVETAKGVDFTEGVDLTGVPQGLQDIIAHVPGNQLSFKRHADFELKDGAWVLHGIG
ncbi:MAG: hypothetical protein WCA37_14275 [Terracidiphilus sp.]